MRSAAGALALAVAASAVALALAEGLLRLGDFSYQLGPQRVEFGWPDPLTLERVYRPDPDLFWVPQDYEERLRRASEAHPDVVFMGDSCTEFGDYPRLFVELVQRRHPDRGLRAENLGVAGWSSHQGLRQLERDVLPLRPAIVTLYYGWNDHWAGLGVEDREIHAPDPSGWRSLRLIALLRKAHLAVRVWRRAERPERVPLPRFRENLRAMTRLARQQGIVPVLLTAPSAHRVGHEPPRLARRLRSLDQLVPLHQTYVEAVRRVAEEEDVALCDLAARFAALPADAVRERYFLRDGIHPRPAGHRQIAALLYACLMAEPELRRALLVRR